MAKTQPINVTFHFRKPNFLLVNICVCFFHFLDILLPLIISLPAFLLFLVFSFLAAWEKMVHICWVLLAKKNEIRGPLFMCHLIFPVCFFLFCFGFSLVCLSFRTHFPICLVEKIWCFPFVMEQAQWCLNQWPFSCICTFFCVLFVSRPKCKAFVTRRYTKAALLRDRIHSGRSALGAFPSLPRFIFNDCKQDFLLTTMQSIRKQTKSHAPALVACFTFVSCFSRALLFIALLGLLLMHGFFPPHLVDAFCVARVRVLSSVWFIAHQSNEKIHF